ncbi:MAG: hypothetical protein Kow0047_12340 [Anaerolineae bacterium]
MASVKPAHEPRWDDLIRQGRAAARAGARSEARELFEQATRVAPDRAEAWLELAGVVEDPDEKRALLKRVLEIDPENEEAKAGLDWLEGRTQPAPPEAVEETLYCVNHPQRETLLRCNKCGRPMCIDCVQLTDVGYRCRDCINQVQASFYTAEAVDYPIAAGIGFLVAAIASPLVGIAAGMLGWIGLWIAFFAGPAAGGALAEVVRSAIRRRRGRYLWLAACGGAGLGVVAGNLAVLLFAGWLPLLSLGMLLFVGLALATVYARLR